MVRDTVELRFHHFEVDEEEELVDDEGDGGGKDCGGEVDDDKRAGGLQSFYHVRLGPPHPKLRMRRLEKQSHES